MCSSCKDTLSVRISEWITALKSGDYKQGQGQLIKGTPSGLMYCCLGVYGVLNDGKVRVGLGLKFDDRETPYSCYVPSDLMAQEAQNFFSSLNDSYGLTFKQIASVAGSLPSEAFRSDEWWNDNLYFARAVLAGFKAASA